MKIKIPRQEVLYLEDILLDVFFGLSLDHLEGNEKLRDIIHILQEYTHG